MDWVEKRAQQDARLRSGASRYWQYLKTAMHHAVDSYNEHYKGMYIAGFDQQYDNTFHVIRDLNNQIGNLSTRTMVTVEFREPKQEIAIRYEDGNVHLFPLALDPDNRVGLKHEHAQAQRILDEEAASEFVLERVLFPPEPSNLAISTL